MAPTSRPSPGRSQRTAARGQALVEFAFVFPLFFTLLLGLIEFAFVFNAILAVNYAARDGALAAAEAGNRDGGDCIILDRVEAAVSAPADHARIRTVEIFKAGPNGAMIGTPTVYTRGTTGTTCTIGLNTTLTVPYRLTSDGYPFASRCNTLAGCLSGDSVDNVGVRVSYSHAWLTPITNFAGGGAGGLDFDRTSIMRMEPIL